MAAKPDSIDLLNQTVEREFHVAVQYFLQHDKIEKVRFFMYFIQKESFFSASSIVKMPVSKV